MNFQHVAVLGLGVMGGSFVRALADLDTPPRISAWSPDPADREAVVSAGVVPDAPTTWEEAVTNADLVLLAAPLTATCELLGRVARQAPSDSVVTDVASLKQPVSRAAIKAGLIDRWVGGHPMAGGEGSGFAASRADLYRGARVWLVADEIAANAARRVGALWQKLGAEPAPIDPESHDRLMALVSHLPQLAATSLASVLADFGISPRDLGPGGHDMTRLAGSSSEMWRDLLSHAPPDLAQALRALAATTTELADWVDGARLDDLTAEMDRTRTWREGE